MNDSGDGPMLHGYVFSPRALGRYVASSFAFPELHETCITELSRRPAIHGWTFTPTHANGGEITTLTCALVNTIDDLIVVKVAVKIDSELNVSFK